MSEERELLKEVLEYFDPLGLNTEHCGDLPERIKELLAQPEHTSEPVAWIATGIGGGTAVGWYEKDIVNLPKGTKLYLHPPKRESLGLEIADVCGSEDYREGFKDGALYAEKAHGITGVDDE